MTDLVDNPKDTADNTEHHDQQSQSPRPQCLSPHAMAHAAFTSAVADAKKKQMNNVSLSRMFCNSIQKDFDSYNDSNQAHTNANKVHHTLNDEGGVNTGEENADEPERHICQVWNEFEKICKESIGNGNKSENKRDPKEIFDEVLETALRASSSIISEEVESLIRRGLDAFHEADAKSRELSSTHNLSETRGRELDRLQESETQNRTVISNLLRALEATKCESKDLGSAATVEKKLRAELLLLRTQLDDAVMGCAESKRKTSLLEEEIDLIRGKLARVSQEKVKLERDARAATSLTRSWDNRVSSDSDFYKRKADDLNERLQSQQQVITEQRLQIEKMKQQYERSISQNQLAKIRAMESSSSRKKRKSY